MAYSDQINYLKEALNGYSAEEEKLTALYKIAIENAEKAHSTAMKQLEQQYQDDRNEVYADTARDERNLHHLLAERGLGFSGEAAQAKLNSNITLSNRLGAITKDKNASALQLDLDLAENKSNLSMEEAEKFRDLLDSKNQLNTEIAQLELRKETDEAQMQMERELEAAKLQAEKEMQAAKLRAEKEMQAAELQAKYYSVVSGGGSSGNSSSSSSSSSKNSGSGTGNKADGNENVEGYVPNITAKDLAKQIVNTATSGKNYISDGTHEYHVNKYLLELVESYGVNDDYYDDLLFMLKSYGYEEISIPEMRRQVITYDAKTYYESAYDTAYDRYIVVGMNESQARKKANESALNGQIDLIYGRSKNILEFRQCCQDIGIGNTKINEYLDEINQKKSNASGDSGSGGSHTTRLTK